MCRSRTAAASKCERAVCAASRAMPAVASEMTGDGEIDLHGRPEITLAKFLKKKHVQVWCDPSIKYTVDRTNL